MCLLILLSVNTFAISKQQTEFVEQNLWNIGAMQQKNETETVFIRPTHKP
jgi:hypothetical protein